jgi:hypothetical protein
MKPQKFPTPTVDDEGSTVTVKVYRHQTATLRVGIVAREPGDDDDDLFDRRIYFHPDQAATTGVWCVVVLERAAVCLLMLPTTA